MNRDNLYLKHNVLVEPLINQWYAWGFLVAPQGLAMLTAFYHHKLLNSYIKVPQMHAQAVKNPKMIGGPFLDLPGDQSNVVRTFLETSCIENEDMLRLGKAIRDLDELLAKEAKGHSLQPLYEQVPQELKGFVELGYDLYNNATPRFLERLLYGSHYYNKNRQSLSLFSVNQDQRPFALSTPRFPEKDKFFYDFPFEYSGIDDLFAMKDTPGSLKDIEAWIPDDPRERDTFFGLFSDEPPQFRGRDRTTLGDQMRVKYFGHATLLIESVDVSILTDPVISYEVFDKSVPRYTYADLPEFIDYVVITHAHQDHLMFETLLQLRHKIGHIVVPRDNGGFLQDPSPRLMLEYTGFKNIIELDEMESLNIPGGTITGLPFFGEHGDLHIRAKLGYHVRLGERTMALVADSNNLEPRIYEEVRRHLGPVEKCFIGMECVGAPMSWLYGPLQTKPLNRDMDQSRRLDGSDCKKAADMIKTLGANAAYIYAMGQEPWLTFVSSIAYTEQSLPIVESNRLVAHCHARGLEAERLYGCKELCF